MLIFAVYIPFRAYAVSARNLPRKRVWVRRDRRCPVPVYIPIHTDIFSIYTPIYTNIHITYICIYIYISDHKHLRQIGVVCFINTCKSEYIGIYRSFWRLMKLNCVYIHIDIQGIYRYIIQNISVYIGTYRTVHTKASSASSVSFLKSKKLYNAT